MFLNTTNITWSSSTGNIESIFFLLQQQLYRDEHAPNFVIFRLTIVTSVLLPVYAQFFRFATVVYDGQGRGWILKANKYDIKGKL